MAKAKQLNPQQSRFVDEYLQDFNAQAAAVRAGYSAKTACLGTRLLHHTPGVGDEITRRCLKMQARLEMSADDVRRGFCRIATDPREAKEGGPTHEARIKALIELAKLFGMYTQKIHVTGSITLVDLLLAADKGMVAQQPTETLQ